MITYALVNYAVFVQAIGKSPGWRPSFKYYHWSTSLAGAIICTAIMFMTDYIYAFVAMGVAFGIHKYIEMSETSTHWGSAQESVAMKDAISSLMKLRKVKRHIKNYRPSYLVMAGEPSERPHLIYLGNMLRQTSNTLCVFGNVNVKGPQPTSASLPAVSGGLRSDAFEAVRPRLHSVTSTNGPNKSSTDSLPIVPETEETNEGEQRVEIDPQVSENNFMTSFMANSQSSIRLAVCCRRKARPRARNFRSASSSSRTRSPP